MPHLSESPSIESMRADLSRVWSQYFFNNCPKVFAAQQWPRCSPFLKKSCMPSHLRRCDTASSSVSVIVRHGPVSAVAVRCRGLADQYVFSRRAGGGYAILRAEIDELAARADGLIARPSTVKATRRNDPPPATSDRSGDWSPCQRDEFKCLWVSYRPMCAPRCHGDRGTAPAPRRHGGEPPRP